MKSRKLRFRRRLLIAFAALPLLQFAGCGAEFVASALALGFANQTASVLGTELETSLFTAFGL